MDILAALITEKWLLSAVLFGAYAMERRERIADKDSFRAQREAFIKRLDDLSDALTVIKERIKP